VPLGHQQPTDVVGTAARFHRNDARRQRGSELGDALAVHPTALDHGPVCVQPGQAAAVLAQVDSE
jgi:hypothetical protein